ncbi:MAG: thioesterase family protein [Nocardioides sp.]|nr:thioesterase family protein [Nocardioides sp.]
MAYFHRTGDSSFTATEHVGGAWDTGTQHIASALGLLVHAVETDRDKRRDDGLHIGRLSYDILGTVPVAEFETGVEVLRAGRTIELVEARMTYAGRTIVRLRAWLMEPRDTTAEQGTPFEPIAAPEEMEAFDPTTIWDGGFIASAHVRRHLIAPGRGSYWVRTEHELIAGEKVSTLAARAGLFDIANGMTVRADPRRIAFPNIDLTAHLFREPAESAEGWLGFDTTISFGPGGIGLTSSVLHDADGPLGTVNQVLTVRPN